MFNTAIAMPFTASQKPGHSKTEIYKWVVGSLKFVQVALGAGCAGTIIYDMVANSIKLATGTGIGVIKETPVIGSVVRSFERIVKPVIDLPNSADQLTSRVVFLAVSTIFAFISFIQLIWCPVPNAANDGAAKMRITAFYHLVGFVLHLVASLLVLMNIDELGTDDFHNAEMVKIIAIIGIVNAALYLLSTLLTLWSLVKDSFTCCTRTRAIAAHRRFPRSL